MKALLILLVFVVVGLGVLFLNVPSQTIDKVRDAKPKLSLEQAVGQLLLMGFEASTYTLKLKALMQKIQPGGILLLGRNIQDKAQLKTLVGDLQNVSQIPLLVAVDQEGGRVQRFGEPFTRLPTMRSLGHLYDEDMAQALTAARAFGWLMAAELRAVDVDLSFAPVVDLDLGRIGDPARLNSALNAIPGVVETGLFCGIAAAVVVGEPDGTARFIGQI